MKIKGVPKDYQLRRQIKKAQPYQSRSAIANQARALTQAISFVNGLGDVEDKYLTDSHVPVSEETLSGFSFNSHDLTLVLVGGLIGATICYFVKR